MPDPFLAAPGDWCAIVFGQRDVTPYREDVPPGEHVLPYIATIVGGHEVDTTFSIWRTVDHYLETHVEIALGRSQPDSPTWLSATYRREAALQPGESGVISGVVPLSWLSAITVPTFDATELAAQAIIMQAINAGERVDAIHDGSRGSLIGDLKHPDGSSFLPRAAPRSPLATPPFYSNAYDPNTLVGTITQSFTLTIDRVSMSLLAVARSLSVKEVRLSLVYV